jgi:Ca-activated chloride channel homolog
MSFRFADYWFFLLLALPLIILFMRPKRGGAEFAPFRLLKQTLEQSPGPAIYRALIACAVALLVIAAARPQYGQKITEREQSGRDLVLVIDLSASMQVDDIIDQSGKRGDRLAAVIAAAKRFRARARERPHRPGVLRQHRADQLSFDLRP